MKLLLPILAIAAALLGGLFVIFKLVKPSTVATTPSAALAPAQPLPPPASDKTAQRVTAAAGLVSALAGAASSLGLGGSSSASGPELLAG